MKITKHTFTVGLTILTLLFIVNHILGTFAAETYMRVAAKYFSNDGIISCQECVLQNVDQPILFLALLWVILFIALPKFNPDTFDLLHFQRVSFKLKVIWVSFFTLTISWVFFKFLNIYPELYMEDRLLENLTALFFFLASALLVVKFFRPGMYYRWWLLFVALMFFVIAMEEISWGQRIFGWNTPSSFSSFNHQNETNLHNVLNPFMTPLYVIGNLIIGCFLLFIKEICSYLSRFSWKDKILPALPTITYAGTGFIFLFLSLQRFWFGDELTEQFISLYILIYTLEIYLDTFYIRTTVHSSQFVR